MEQTNKITAGTVARTAVLALALINQVLVILGRPIIEIADEQITQIITLGFTIVTAVINWWYNASFTRAAIVSDDIMHKIKDGTIDITQVKAFAENQNETK